MKIKTRALILAGLILGGSAALSLIILYAKTQVQATTRVLQETVEPFYQDAAALRLQVAQIRMELLEAGAYQAQRQRQQGMEEAGRQAAGIRALLQSLAERDDRAVELTGTIGEAFERFFRIGLRMASDAQRQGEADRSILLNEFRDASVVLVSRLDELLVMAEGFEDEVVGMQEETIADMAWLLMAGIGAMVFFLIPGIVLLIMSIRPLKLLEQEARRIQNNDLTGRLPEGVIRDEVGELRLGIAGMKEGLSSSLRQVTEDARAVSEAVERTLEAADRTRRGVEDQHRETDEVASAVGSMVATFQEVAGNTTAAAEAAKQADTAVAKGRTVIVSNIEQTNRLAGQVERAADVIGRLERDSEQIGAVLDVIRGIAEQTNLLALNAAIEAARAGEQGRGFAVVADEVRTLASRTQESTEEINGMIERLQSGSADAVKVMRESRDQAQANVGAAEEAGQVLEHILSEVNTIHSMSSQIATAVEEQTRVAEEVNCNIRNIRLLGESSAGAAAESAEVGAALQERSQDLQTLVARFRL